MMKRFALFAIGIFWFSISKAQNYSTSADIYLGLKKLNVLGSVLYIAAHPDDENTRLISYFSKDRLYRTGYLSMTRGDGGQNLIGDEQGVELGLIRTQELLAARRIDGGEQFFTRAYDFGYSKTPEETFEKWDKQKILSDVVWIIRKFQPDVIITRFPSTGEGGHGHHTASAILANEAFKAAADPKMFPEQLKYVKTWQAERILWNGFNFNNATPPADAFTMEVGAYNPVLGKSYGEIAAESRSQHKSQGFGSSANRGEAYEWFRLTDGTSPAEDLFTNVETGWEKINAPQIGEMINTILRSFDFLAPGKSVKPLVALHKAMQGLPASVWKQKKLGELENLIIACSGLFADATTSVPYVAQTDSVKMSFILNNRMGSDIVLKGITVDDFDSSFVRPLRKNINESFVKSFYVPITRSVTQPYWLVQEMKEGHFDVTDQQLIGQPDIQAAFTARFSLEIEGLPIELERKVRYRFNDPVKGEVYQPFVVVPAYTMRIIPEHIVRVAESTVLEKIYTSYKNNNEVKASSLINNLPPDVLSLNKNQTASITDNLRWLQKGRSLQKEPLQLGYRDAHNLPVRDMITIAYDHIPNIRYFKEATSTFQSLDLKTAGKKIGYIIGAGDKVPQALEQMGFEVTLLTDKELGRNHLQQFDAIIAGVRAYNTNDWLNQYHDKLMAYVKDGGNLIVQYNTSNNIGPVRAKIGPYAFEISRTRITNEGSPVNFLIPEHRVFHFPNRITPDDFKGWIQERSIYHAGKRDSIFQAVLGMQDPNEKMEDGSLIIAPYGKGYFTYTGLVFFRQLPAGVPGAFRLMANLIALNAKKGF